MSASKSLFPAFRRALANRTWFAGGLILLAQPMFAQVGDVDYADFNLDALSQVQISSLGRKNASVFDTPAAGAILSDDDINRAGATTLGEALRLVPGVQVGQVDAYNYGITARGFNDFTSNKLLVLADGRSIYDPLISGTQWTYETPFFPDISRIEVLRGPAAALWGSNAMNGVINMVTKSAHETLGTFFSAAFGDELEAQVLARHGWKVSPSTAMRVYVRHTENGNFGIPMGAGSLGWNSTLAGLRMDWERPAGGVLTLTGEYRRLRSEGVSLNPLLTAPYYELFNEARDQNGGFVMGRWIQPVPFDGELRVQASAEHVRNVQDRFKSDRNTFAFDSSLMVKPFPRHELMGGIAYNGSFGNVQSGRFFIYANPTPVTEFAGAFVQDEITLLPQRLTVTIGTKAEQNSYSGLEIQPSARVLFKPAPNHALWAAVSRAARTPSSSERDVLLLPQVDGPSAISPFPIQIGAYGNRNFSSEHLVSTELGYRWKITPKLNLDVATYYNRYEELRGISNPVISFVPTPVPHIFSAVYANNDLFADTYGGEAAIQWEPAKRWRVEASVASLHMALHDRTVEPILDPTIEGIEGDSPNEEYKLRISMPVTARGTLDLIGRHVGVLRSQAADAYTALDARFGWTVTPHWEIELVGKNLTEPKHAEMSEFFIEGQAMPISRSAFVRFTFKY